MSEDLVSQYAEKRIKSYTLKAVDKKGRTVYETKMEIRRNDTIIMQFPSDWSEENLERLADSVTQSMRNDGMILFIPDDVKIKVLSVNED